MRNQTPFNLPDDAFQFLREGRQLEYDFSRCEAGQIILHYLEELSIGQVWVDGFDSENIEAEGYFAIPAVSLSRECDGYAPEFLLLWLPAEHLFGAWHNDHWVLKVFPGATWAQIIANPLPYLNAQWGHGEIETSEFYPHHTYLRQIGRPF